MNQRRHLLASCLSCDARVEHLPAEVQDEDHGDYVRTKCGKLGRWRRWAPRDGTLCKRCERA